MKKVKKIIFGSSFVFYLAGLLLLFHVGATFVGNERSSLLNYLKNSSNFIPFKTIRTYITALVDGNLNQSTPLRNLLGNLVMFLPSGIYLPYYLRKTRKLRKFMLSMTVILFGVQITQSLANRGRFDIDDFILNLAGALLGYRLWKTKFIQRLLR